MRAIMKKTVTGEREVNGAALHKRFVPLCGAGA